jgi:hypothetical protein
MFTVFDQPLQDKCNWYPQNHHQQLLFPLLKVLKKLQVVQNQSDRRTRNKPGGGVAALRRTTRLVRTAEIWLVFNDL